MAARPAGRTPFIVAIGLRRIIAGNLLTRWLITLSTVWFAAAGMRHDVQYLRSLLP